MRFARGASRRNAVECDWLRRSCQQHQRLTEKDQLREALSSRRSAFVLRATNLRVRVAYSVHARRPCATIKFPGLRLLLAVRPEGADHQWRRVPPGELSIDPVASERLGR